MRRAGAAPLLAATLLAGCGGGGAAAPRPSHTTTAPAKAAHPPAHAVSASPSARLTLRQAVGQHMVFAYSGATPPAALVKRIERGEAAGVVLFSRNVRDLDALRTRMDALQALQKPGEPPLLIMVDQEGGSVRRLPGPPERAPSDTTSKNAAYDSGAAAGKLLAGHGINVDLAPVVDVARPGSVLAAEGRTFGRDPATVAERAAWFSGGLRGHGVQTVYKHFPGFGAATVNTDDATARIDLPLSTLRAIDGKVYEKLHPSAVMVSTAIYPRVDPRPAVFSRRWVTGELRGRLKYRDVVAMTDDLQAPAVTKYGSPAQLAYFALRAGIDLPLFAKDYTTGARAAAGLERAVRTGALSRRDLDAGTDRVLAWRMDVLTGG